MYLVDSNIFLEGLLEQEKSKKVDKFFKEHGLSELAISDLSLFSIAIILTKLNKKDLFLFFLNDIIIDGVEILTLDKSLLPEVINTVEEFDLDFEDAYQYTISKVYNLQLVSFDKDFDNTNIKRIEP